MLGDRQEREGDEPDASESKSFGQSLHDDQVLPSFPDEPYRTTVLACKVDVGLVHHHQTFEGGIREDLPNGR